MVKRILVGLGSLKASQAAVRHALQLCQQHGAELTAVTVVDLRRLEQVGPVPIGAGEAAHELREHRIKLSREIAEQSCEDCRSASTEAGVSFQIVYEEGNPLDEIVSRARYHDLMVFGLDQHLFEHGVIDDPPDELIRLVREGVHPILGVTEEYRLIQRVLIAYSGSVESAHTMRRFIQMRLWPEATLRIVTFDKTAEEADRLLSDAQQFCRAYGRNPEIERVEEKAYNHILPYANEHNFDLIVVGNSARSLLLREVFGETALQVIRTTDRPIFTAQ